MLGIDPSIYSLIIFALLTLLQIISYFVKDRIAVHGSLRVMWVLFLVITLSEWVSFTISLWIIALLAFYALREFFSLVDIRIEDRFGILISYLSIPFMKPHVSPLASGPVRSRRGINKLSLMPWT